MPDRRHSHSRIDDGLALASDSMKLADIAGQRQSRSALGVRTQEDADSPSCAASAPPRHSKPPRPSSAVPPATPEPSDSIMCINPPESCVIKRTTYTRVVKSARHRRQGRPCHTNGTRPAAELTGWLSWLPSEVLEDKILSICDAKALACVESTCRYFAESLVPHDIAKRRVHSIPRAKSLRPNTGRGDDYLKLLHYVCSQSNAAAQSTAVSCGAFHTLCLLVHDSHPTSSDGRKQHCMYAFGRGFHGQLGHSGYEAKYRPTSVFLGYRLLADDTQREEETMAAVVSCGSSHSCAISRRGELYTWGLASSGELGHTGVTPIEVPDPCSVSLPTSFYTRVVSIAAGANHTLAISEHGDLWSCGRGRHGQLGHADYADVGALSKIPSLHVSVNSRIVSAAAGQAHSMALASDGSLYSWGDCVHGQLGHGEYQSFVEHHVEDLPNVAVPGFHTPRKVQALHPHKVKASQRVTAIAAGGYHSFALTVGGDLMGFGRNKHGSLGLGTVDNVWTPTRVELARSGENTSCVRAVQVACGMHHSVVVVTRNGKLQARSTGSNYFGQLGLGDNLDRHQFTPIPSLEGTSPVCVQCGDQHSVAVSDEGSLYLWGRGDFGQMGADSDRSHWKPRRLEGYTVVHPDRTLRRNKRCLPVTRPVAKPEEHVIPKLVKTPFGEVVAVSMARLKGSSSGSQPAAGSASSSQTQ